MESKGYARWSWKNLARSFGSPSRSSSGSTCAKALAEISSNAVIVRRIYCFIVTPFGEKLRWIINSVNNLLCNKLQLTEQGAKNQRFRKDLHKSCVKIVNFLLLSEE